MNIGDVLISGPVVLAPMAGITTSAYRKFMYKFGVNLAYTEMISDSGLVFNNEVTYTYLPQKDEPRPITIQLFGGETNKLVQAIKKIEKITNHYDVLDLNLGCPVPKVTRNNGGSAWLKHEDELIEMVEEVVKNSTKPVTVKIRIGWDDTNINFKILMPRLEAAGVKAIALHLRTTKQLYGGTARYDIANNIQELINIPLIISGDIYTLEDAINAMEITKAQGIMLARGQLGNPFLAQQISTYFATGKKLPIPTLEKQLEYLLDLATMMVEEKGEKFGILVMRGIAPHFLKGFPFTKPYKIRLIQEMESLRDLKDIIDTIKHDALLGIANNDSI